MPNQPPGWRANLLKECARQAPQGAITTLYSNNLDGQRLAFAVNLFIRQQGDLEALTVKIEAITRCKGD